MVLSSGPILILIPLTALILNPAGNWKGWSQRTIVGCLLAIGAYAMTNPYVVWNALFHREVLGGNLSNSTAMYRVAEISQGAARVLELTREGATLPILAFGAAGLLLMLWKMPRRSLFVTLPALLFFVQFALIGAGKPAEYGRFGVFTDAILCVGCSFALACLRDLGPPGLRIGPAGIILGLILFATGRDGLAYLEGFVRDQGTSNSRLEAAGTLQNLQNYASAVCLTREPAPYACPPMDFERLPVLLIDPVDPRAAEEPEDPMITSEAVVVDTADERLTIGPPGYQMLQTRERGLGVSTPISWADKPFMILIPERLLWKMEDAEIEPPSER